VRELVGSQAKTKRNEAGGIFTRGFSARKFPRGLDPRELRDQKSLDNKSRQLRKLKKFGSQLMPVTGVQRVSRRRSLAVILIQ